MASPGAIAAANLGRRASKVAELQAAARLAPPPVPAPPPPAASVKQWRHPMQDQWDRRFHDFNVRWSQLTPPPEGHVRLYRGGEIPVNGPPRSPDDVIGDPFGNPMTRRQLDELKGGGHANPFEAEGRWFTDAPDELDFYLTENDTSPAYYVDVPADVAAQHNVKNTPFMRNSRNPEREFVLPADQANRATKLLDGLKVK